MKKFFTLITMVLMAIGASAQGSYKVTGEIADGTTISSVTGITATFSDKWSTKEKDAVTYNGTTYDVCVGGANNPSPSPKTAVPTSGCFIKFSPAADGTVTVIAYINSSKKVWIYEGSTTISKYTISSGEVNNGNTFSDNYAGPISFAVTANKDYVIALEGSKLMTYGFEYTLSGTVEEKAPTISVPETATGFINSEVSIAASVTGYPTPAIQWYSNTSASTTGGTEISGETSGTLKVTEKTAGTYYFYAVATNSKGSATSNVCTLTANDPNITVSDKDKIVFPTVYGSGALNGCTIIGGNLELTITDTGKKTSTADCDKNIYFGTADSYSAIQGRLKTGGTSSANKLALSLNVKKAGKLNVYARTGSSSSDRKIVLTQNNSEILSQTLSDGDAITVTSSGKSVNGSTSATADGEKLVYPIYNCDVAVGTVDIAFPDGSISIYAIDLDGVATGINDVNAVEVVSNTKLYNTLGQRVNANAKGLLIQNGKKYIAK